jgi:TonB family protein
MKALWDGSLQGSGYGAPELRQYYQKSMSRSLVLSIALQIVCFAAYYVFRAPEDQREPPRIAEVIPYRFLIPPSLFQTNISSSAVASAKNLLRPKYAIPIPVADPFVDSSITIPSQRQPGENSGVYGEVFVPGGGVDQAIELEDDVEPAPFRPIEKVPEIAKRVEPKYPEAAIRAGIEGTVVLSVWVDRLGRVRKAVVLRSDAPILVVSAKEAAMQWVFTPAIMQHNPVSVWVSIPFTFKLSGK